MLSFIAIDCVSKSSGLPVAVVRDDVVPFLGGGAGDEGDDGLGLTQIEDLVRHAGFDVDKITGFVFQHLLEPRSEFVTHLALENVKN